MFKVHVSFLDTRFLHTYRVGPCPSFGALYNFIRLGRFMNCEQSKRISWVLNSVSVYNVKFHPPFTPVNRRPIRLMADGLPA